MNRMVLIEENLYKNLITNRTPESVESQQLNNLLDDPKIKSDQKVDLYNQKIKSSKNAKSKIDEMLPNFLEKLQKIIENKSPLDRAADPVLNDEPSDQSIKEVTSKPEKISDDSSSSSSSSTPTSDDSPKPKKKSENSPKKIVDPEDLKTKAEDICKRLKAKSNILPIKPNGAIKNSKGHEVSRSNLEKIVNYWLSGSNGRAPNGAAFLNAEIIKHPELAELVGLKGQSGGGRMVFRPKLWKKY